MIIIMIIKFIYTVMGHRNHIVMGHRNHIIMGHCSHVVIIWASQSRSHGPLQSCNHGMGIAVT